MSLPSDLEVGGLKAICRSTLTDLREVCLQCAAIWLQDAGHIVDA